MGSPFTVSDCTNGMILDTNASVRESTVSSELSTNPQVLTDDECGAELFVPEGGFALLNSVAVDGAGSCGVSCTIFDGVEELLWTGNSGGHVTSYYSSSLEKYTSFQVVSRNEERPEIRGLLTNGTGIFSLSQRKLKCNRRQGLGVFNYTSGNLVDVQCMLFSPASASNVVLGGFQRELIQLDVDKLQENRVTRILEQDCTILRSNDNFLFSGDTGGNVTLRNPQTLESVQILEAHNGSLSDFDVCGMKLVTCGFSYRLGQLQCDRFLMLYDLRTLRAQRPVPLNFEPSFIRFLPTYSDNRLVVASQTGEFQVFEIGEATSIPFQVETEGTGIFCLDVSPSKECIAMGDGAGVLHLFSDRAEPVFNNSARSTEFADPVVPVPAISFEDVVTPYTVIPFPLCQSGPLLSDWPAHLCKRVYRKPVPVDAEILKSMRVSQFVGYAPNPGTKLRNQVPYDIQPAGANLDLTNSDTVPSVSVTENMSESLCSKGTGDVNLLKHQVPWFRSAMYCAKPKSVPKEG